MARLIIFLFLAAILSSFSLQTQAAQSQLHNDFRKCLYLHPANSKGIYTPDNLRLLPSTSTLGPRVIVTPDHESQIQSVLLCAKKTGMQIQTRSGGRDLTSASSRDPFIILDLVNLNEISVDADSKTAWVQAGATLEQLNSRIAERSKRLAIPAGIGSNTGVGDHFSGSDHIVDARIVDVEGRILDRESMGVNRFLAIRGTGTASFEVVIAYKVSLATVPEIISLASDTKTLEQTATERKQQSSDRIVEKLNQTFPRLGDDSDVVRQALFACLLNAYTFEVFSSIVSLKGTRSYTPNLESSIRNLRFNLSTTPKPQVIITPVSESQIPPVIHCAKEKIFQMAHLQISIRSGGHDYEGRSYVSEEVPFVILDMKKLNKIEVDVEQKTAWVGAGTSLGELYYEINHKSDGTLGFPGGVCPTVCVGGLIGGGGSGMMVRKHGVAADHVLDAKIIDAEGKILDSIDSTNPKLLWAIRGGGGASFGVILAWKLQLVDVPPKVTVFRISRTSEPNARQLVYRWQEIAHTLKKDLLLRVILSRVANPTQDSENKVEVTFNALYLGGVDELIPYMEEKFPELRLKKEECQPMSWIESVLYFGTNSWKNPLEVLKERTTDPSELRYFKAKSDFVQEPMSQSGLKVLWRIFDKVEAEKAQVFLTPNGGKMSEIPENKIAFPHRGEYYRIQYIVYWNKEEGSDDPDNKYMKWIKKVYTDMAPYVSNPRYAYFNHRDLDIGVNNLIGETSYEQASKWGIPYFKGNFEELVKVKTNVDPYNFFRYEQSIPTLRSMWTKASA